MKNKKGISYLAWTTFVVLTLFLSLSSCCPKVIERTITVTEKVYRDSIAWRDTTISVPIPLEKDQAIVRLGDTSRLETSVAESTAYIDKNGDLRHELTNKKGSLSAVTKIPVRYIFNGVTTNTTQTLTKTEYKDRPLSWWQKFRMSAFWWLLVSTLLLLVWTFRKQLFTLIKRI